MERKINMAKVSEKKEKQTIKAKALVFLKYDKDCYKIGDELNVRVEDAPRMIEKGYIEALEEIAAEKTASKDGE